MDLVRVLCVRVIGICPEPFYSCQGPSVWGRHTQKWRLGLCCTKWPQWGEGTPCLKDTHKKENHVLFLNKETNNYLIHGKMLEDGLYKERDNGRFMYCTPQCVCLEWIIFHLAGCPRLLE